MNTQSLRVFALLEMVLRTENLRTPWDSTAVRRWRESHLLWRKDVPGRDEEVDIERDGLWILQPCVEESELPRTLAQEGFEQRSFVASLFSEI